MRRRLSTFLTGALLALAVLLPASAAAAADVVLAEGATVTLATEGHTSTEGLDPMAPDDEDNEFRPADYEPNWTWRVGGKALLVAFLFVALYLGLMYYLRVVRPAARSNQS